MVSGATRSRPVLDKMLEYVREGDTVYWSGIIKVQYQNTRKRYRIKEERCFEMKRYDKQFKEEAVGLSKEIGTKQLGLSYHTLVGWRSSKQQHGERAFIGSGQSYNANQGQTLREIELQREVDELRRANEILKDALGFFAKDRKK